MNEQRRKKKDVAILPMSKLSLFRYEDIYIIFKLILIPLSHTEKKI